jgi:hypothetical protein
MIIVAVQSLVMDPSWNTESMVTGDLCRGVEHAVRGQDLLPVGPDTQRSPGDVRFSGQFIEADGPVSGIEHDMDANSPKPGLTLTARSGPT